MATAPLVRPLVNELGQPLSPMNELGDPLPPTPDPEPTPVLAPVMTPGQQQITRDQQALQKVRFAQDNPWGTENNHPGKVGKIAHVLSVAGNIAGGAILPGITERIPGSQLNLQAREGDLAKRLNTEITDESQNQDRAATTARQQEELAEAPQKAADTHDLSQSTQSHLDAETQAAQTPSLATAYAHAVQDALKNGRNPADDPIVQHISDAIVGLQPKQNLPPEAPKTTDIKGPDGKVHTMGFDAKTGKYDVDEGESGFKPSVTNVNAGTAALDRETKQFGTPHQKSLDSATAQLEKIADARNMINGNAEAQGLGIPKVLTALVGGQGTGVRITQAELQSIAHARGLEGDVEGTLNKWSGKGALSKEQQHQLTSILDDVKNRIQQKQAIASDTLDTINGATSREQIIQADKTARQKLADLEKGGGEPARPANVPEGYKFDKNGPKGAGWYK